MVAGLVLMAAVAAALLAILIPGPHRAPRPPQGFEVALQDNGVFLRRAYYDRERAFRQAERLGVSWLRVSVLWRTAAGRGADSPRVPAAERWSWGPVDDVVTAARAHGMHLELTLTGPAPAWATGDRRIGVYSPSPRRFGDFARAAAAHFRGRVDRYSIWNEPNYAAWLTPRSRAPGIYRDLYLAGYAAVKRADPHAQVLIGETAGPAQPGLVIASLTFLRAVTCRDATYRPTARCPRLLADGYAYHPYDFEHPPEHVYPGANDVTLGSLGRLTRTLDELARSGALSTPEGRPLDVYLTEFGYFARGRRSLPAGLRADYLRRAFELAASHFPRVRQLLQYLLVSPPSWYPGAYFDTSIVREDGTEEPPFEALAGWAAGERHSLIERRLPQSRH